MTYNQMALHTLDGCFAATGTDETGTSGGNNCSTPSGCTVVSLALALHEITKILSCSYLLRSDRNQAEQLRPGLCRRGWRRLGNSVRCFWYLVRGPRLLCPSVAYFYPGANSIWFWSVSISTITMLEIGLMSVR